LYHSDITVCGVCPLFVSEDQVLIVERHTGKHWRSIRVPSVVEERKEQEGE